jgi:hypothetical protein
LADSHRKASDGPIIGVGVIHLMKTAIFIMDSRHYL